MTPCDDGQFLASRTSVHARVLAWLITAFALSPLASRASVHARALAWLITAFALSPFTLLAQSYFQQRVDYTIDVRLDDVRNELLANESFVYTNNSPQALDTIRIHLWPNAYKGRNTALCHQLDAQNNFVLHFADENQRGWIDSLDFKVVQASSPVIWGLDPQNPDIGWIKLPSPLASGSSITITTPFRVHVPSARISRLGHIGDAFYITQWFPKPAVFDNKGWHAMPFLHQGEFYSEFGSFDVHITLPENYVVGATGELQDAGERAWMDSLSLFPPTMIVSTVLDKFPTSSARMKTLHFKQDNVHDFAWFADKRYQVKKGSVTLPRSGHTVTTWVLVTPHNATMWKDAITYVNESVRLYSQWVGDYPYSACTAIDGGSAAGGGMEYPMVTIINDSSDPFELDVVIAHEVGHNWFYGMLGSNEREHAWMDEGINSFYEQRYVETRYPGKKFMDLQGIPLGFLTNHQGITYRQQNELQYRYNARRNWDSPIDSHAKVFSELDYGTTVYSKTALVFDQLRSYLGDSLFDKSMQAYFDEWHYKHPYPEDVRDILESGSRRNLGWCFNNLIAGSRKIDAMGKVLCNDGTVTIRTKGSENPWPMPLPVTAWHDGALLGSTWIDPDSLRFNEQSSCSGRDMTIDAHQGRATWLRAESLPWSGTNRVRIDAIDHTLDIDRRNNEVRAHGLLKRRKLPEVKFLAGLEREVRKSIYWTPAIAKNSHDGFMAGLVLHNTTFPNQRFEWVAAPLYGTKSERLAGGARFVWNHDRLRSDLLRNIHVGVSGFAASLYSVERVKQWYQRAVPSIQFDLRSRPTGTQTDIRYRSVIIWQNAKGPFFNGQEDVQVDQRTENIFHEVRVHSERKNGLHPFDVSLTGLTHEAFSRVSLDATWSAIYDVHKHRVSFRLFAGDFLRKDPALLTREMGWRLHWGSSDLLYDHLFVDRQYVGQNTAQQFVKDQGGFKTPTANGTSDTWIAAMNMEADFPFKLPLSVFASYGAAPYTIIDQNGKSTDWRGYWEAGIGVRIVRDVVEMWVPLAYSTEIKDEVETLRGFDFTERIRFVFALERMDPTQALRKAPH